MMLHICDSHTPVTTNDMRFEGGWINVANENFLLSDFSSAKHFHNFCYFIA